MGGSTRAGSQGEAPAARPGKGHLAAAPDPPPPADESQREELAELITAAVRDVLDRQPRGAQALSQVIQKAASMGITEAFFAAMEAHVGHVHAVLSELEDAEIQLQQARGQLAAMQAALDATRADAAAAHDRLYRKERPAPPKRRRPMPTPADDVAGQDRRPDPETARTPAELMGTLREFRQWAGAPPYRVMAERSGWGASTLNTIINSDELPSRLAKIDAVLTGCGAGKEDHERFASAWRRLSMPGTPARANPQDPLPPTGTESFRPFIFHDPAAAMYLPANYNRVVGLRNWVCAAPDSA